MAQAVSIPNPVKELLKAGRVALGMNVRLARSGDIACIAKTCGHDFIFNSEIAFILAEGARVTGELRRALGS